MKEIIEDRKIEATENENCRCIVTIIMPNGEKKELEGVGIVGFVLDKAEIGETKTNAVIAGKLNIFDLITVKNSFPALIEKAAETAIHNTVLSMRKSVEKASHTAGEAEGAVNDYFKNLEKDEK